MIVINGVSHATVHEGRDAGAMVPQHEATHIRTPASHPDSRSINCQLVNLQSCSQS